MSVPLRLLRLPLEGENILHFSFPFHFVMFLSVHCASWTFITFPRHVLVTSLPSPFFLHCTWLVSCSFRLQFLCGTQSGEETHKIDKTIGRTLHVAILGVSFCPKRDEDVDILAVVDQNQALSFYDSMGKQVQKSKNEKESNFIMLIIELFCSVLSVSSPTDWT